MKPKPTRSRRGNYDRRRLNWGTHLSEFENRAEFIKFYKISPEQFMDLVGKLRATCEVRTARTRKHKNGISTEIQLSMTLRMLALLCTTLLVQSMVLQLRLESHACVLTRFLTRLPFFAGKDSLL